MDDTNRAPLDLDSLGQTRDALLDLVHPDERKVVSIAFENLIEIHAAGRVRLTQIDGPTSILRKALRETWLSGVLAPLARSRDVRVRSLLVALPDAFPLSEHESLSRHLTEAAASLPADAQGVLAHLARAVAYLDAIPVILTALDSLATLPRVFVKDEATPVTDHRGMFALRRIRQAFSRDIAPLSDEVATVAHKAPLGCVGNGDFALTAVVLESVPPTGIRKRDPSGAEWIGRFGDALAGDVVHARADKAVEKLFRRFPGIALEKASVRRVGRLGARLEIRLAYESAALVLAYGIDLETGNISSEALGTRPGSEQVTFSIDEAGEFLAPLKPRGPRPKAAPVSARRRGPRTGNDKAPGSR